MTFIEVCKCLVQLKWKNYRGKVIVRSLERKRKERTLKICYLRLLENILLQKKRRIVDNTIRDFREHNLREKVLRILKYKW